MSAGNSGRGASLGLSEEEYARLLAILRDARQAADDESDADAPDVADGESS